MSRSVRTQDGSLLQVEGYAPIGDRGARLVLRIDGRAIVMTPSDANALMLDIERELQEACKK